MCGFYEALGGIGSYLNSRTDARMIRTQADFDAAQFEIAGVLASADASRQKTGLLADFNAMAQQNLAAAAISGLGSESFSGVRAGNDENLRGNQRTITAGLRARQSELQGQADMTRLQGRINARAALAAGTASLLSNLADAETTYQQAHMAGESRGQNFLRSMGLDPDTRKNLGKRFNSFRNYFGG